MVSRSLRPENEAPKRMRGIVIKPMGESVMRPAGAAREPRESCAGSAPYRPVATARSVSHGAAEEVSTSAQRSPDMLPWALPPRDARRPCGRASSPLPGGLLQQLEGDPVRRGTAGARNPGDKRAQALQHLAVVLADGRPTGARAISPDGPRVARHRSVRVSFGASGHHGDNRNTDGRSQHVGLDLETLLLGNIDHIQANNQRHG